MSRQHSSLVAAVARSHPSLSSEDVRAIALAIADELYSELIRRSQRWQASGDAGAAYREQEARACASLVFALGEVG